MLSIWTSLKCCCFVWSQMKEFVYRCEERIVEKLENVAIAMGSNSKDVSIRKYFNV